MQSYSNPALDCGIDPNDGLLVSYLPKLDTVLREAYFGDETAHSIDGILLDVTRPDKPVRWWQVRRAAFELKLALPIIVWQGTASKFSEEAFKMFSNYEREDGHKPYMRAYSHGPWICIDDKQLKEVYGD